MNTDTRRRLEALERSTSTTSTASTESPRVALLRKLGVGRPVSSHSPRWEHYDPAALAFEAHRRLEALERSTADLRARAEALMAGTMPYPEHITTPTAQRAHRDTLAREIRGARAALRLLTDVRTTAGLDVGRAVEPHPDPRFLPPLSDVSIAELVTLRARYLTPTTESETP